MADVLTDENKQLARDFDDKVQGYEAQQRTNASLKKKIEAEMDKVVVFLEAELRLRSTVLAEEVTVKGNKDMRTFTVKYFNGKSASHNSRRRLPLHASRESRESAQADSRDGQGLPAQQPREN